MVRTSSVTFLIIASGDSSCAKTAELARNNPRNNANNDFIKFSQKTKINPLQSELTGDFPVVYFTATVLQIGITDVVVFVECGLFNHLVGGQQTGPRFNETDTDQ